MYCRIFGYCKENETKKNTIILFMLQQKRKNVVTTDCNHLDFCKNCESKQKKKRCPCCYKECKLSQVTIIITQIR